MSIFLFSIFQIISLFGLINNQKYIENSLYPSALKLLDNEGVVMVTSDGIHFYSEDMNEEVSKKITFETQIQSIDESEKIEICQFSSFFVGYIMVLSNDTLYIFSYDWNIIKSVDLKDSINGIHYCLIPYIKEDNYLYYLISYPIDEKSFNLIYFKFNIISGTNEIIRNNTIFPKTEEETDRVPINLSGVNCIFITHQLFNYELLVCFYAVYYPSEVQERTFDPKNNFTELNEYFNYYAVSEKNMMFPYFIYAVTNEEKTEAHIFMSEFYAYEMKFDFNNYFQKPILLSEHYTFRSSFSHNKIYYFSQTHECIFATQYVDNCNIYEIILDASFTKKNEGIINPSNNCFKSNTFSLFYNGNMYTLIMDNILDKQILIVNNADLGTNNIENQISEKSLSSFDIDISSHEKNEIIKYNYSLSIDFYNNFKNLYNFY